MNSLYIIGGAFKNRKLQTPKGSTTRPTTAILRKAVFDIVASIIDDASFLDLFGGTGAMGLEALSRGAKHATFIEQDQKALAAIFANIELLQVEKQTTVLAQDIQKGLQNLQKKQTSPFSIIYCDPPYDKASLLKPIVEFLDQSSLIQKETRIFLEEGYPSLTQIDELKLKRIQHKNTRRFGNSLLHQYEVAL